MARRRRAGAQPFGGTGRTMIVEIGAFSLALALALSVAQALAGGLARWRRSPVMSGAGQGAAIGAFVALLVAFAALMYAFVTSDFSVANVAANSHTAKPLLYRVAGTWGSHEGSMLLWCLALTGCGAAVALYGRDLPAGLKTLTLVETLFFTDFHHRAGVRPVRGPAQRHLIDDSGTVHQPADYADIGPTQRRIVKDGGVFHLAVEHLLIDVLPGAAQRFRRAVEVEPVPGFVLHFRQQDRFSAQRRRAGDPVPFRQHADNFGVRMLTNLTDQRLTVGVRHPVLRLNRRLLRYALLKPLFLRHVITFMIR